MLEYGLAFAMVRVNLHRVKIQIQPVTRFYLQQPHHNTNSVNEYHSATWFVIGVYVGTASSP